MEIPNYDSSEKSNNGFKQLYRYMPKNTFRMLLAGNSGSGKTNLLSHILQSPLIYYDQIHLYAKNLDQDKYINLIDKMNGISEHVGYPVLIASNDEIIPVDQLDNDMQRVVIFDDYVCEKVQKPLIDYFIQGRHKNCSVIYLTQSFYGCPKAIRLNCSHFCLYDFPSSRERNLISHELGIDKEKYIKATNKPYSFCYVDKTNENSEEKLLWKYLIYLYMGIFNDNSQNDHYGHFKVVERGPPGPAGKDGTGFELTDKGNYDMDAKRLTDVAEPVDGKDATTKDFVEKEIPHHPTTHYNLKKSFDFYDDNGVKIDLITDKINGLLSDYNYGYFKIPKSGDDVTFSFCKLLVRNDIEKSTYSALFYFYGFENDTLITGQDLGPILFDVRGVNCNILKYYDDDDSVHTQDHVKGVVWFTNTETNFGFEINLRFFDKSITHFVVLSRCVEGKVNLSFSLNIFNVAHNASLTYFFEDINMNGRKIKVVGSPVDVEDVANKNYVDNENAKQDIAIADKANKSYVDGEIAKVHLDTTPLLPRNGSRSMFGDLDMDDNHILNIENLTDYEIYNPLDLNYRIKDLKSVVNKEYLNENFLKMVDKDGIEYYDLKQIVIKNSAPYDDGSYDNNTLVSKALLFQQMLKLVNYPNQIPMS